MNHKSQRKSGKWYVTHFLLFVRKNSFLIFLLVISSIYAQQETNFRNFSIHAGVNSDILSSKIGPSFSFHYAHPSEKPFQFESMLFFDSHSGTAFLSGESQKNFGYGLAAGTRLNIMRDKNWHPSLLIMPGLIYSSEETSGNNSKRSGLSATVCFAASIAFYKKHMVSLGLNGGNNISAVNLKYGFWF